jgi:hypothetical protein
LPTIVVYRGFWADEQNLRDFQNHVPLLPRAVSSSRELDEMVEEAIRNFGTLRDAALHHLTGATGVAPNMDGKPVFTFWTKNRLVALHHLAHNLGIYGKVYPVIIEAEIDADSRIIVASEAHLYDEYIEPSNETTFEGARWEEEVFIAKPVINYAVRKMKRELIIEYIGTLLTPVDLLARGEIWERICDSDSRE